MGDFAFGSNAFPTKSTEIIVYSLPSFLITFSKTKRVLNSISADGHVKTKTAFIPTPRGLWADRTGCIWGRFSLQHAKSSDSGGRAVSARCFCQCTLSNRTETSTVSKRLLCKSRFRAGRGGVKLCLWTYDVMYLMLLRARSKMSTFYCSNKMYRCCYGG